jgi:hypothetical protein
MNKNLFIIVLAILVLAGLGYYFFTKFRAPTLAPELPQPPTPPVFEVPTMPTPATPTSPTSTTSTSEFIIKITANGFEPEEVEIYKGPKVTWIN